MGFYFGDFHTVPPRGFLRTFSVIEDIIRKQNPLSLLLLQLV